MKKMIIFGILMFLSSCLDQIAKVLKNLDDNDTGLDDILAKVIKPVFGFLEDLVKMAGGEEPFNPAVLIDHLRNFLPEIFAGIDVDENGIDDLTARLLDPILGAVNKILKKELDKELVLMLLEVIQTIVESIPKFQKFAAEIEKIKNSIDND